MSNAVYRPFVEKLGNSKVNNFIGVKGEMFYDPKIGELRISDGVTPGGAGLFESAPWAEDIFEGPWVQFVRPDYSPEVVDEILPVLVIARNPMEGNGSIYNATAEEDGSTSTPYGTGWNTQGWGDLTNIKNRYYEDLQSAWDGGGGYKTVHFEWVMKYNDGDQDHYYLVRFLTWDSGTNDATGAFSYMRRKLNVNAFFNRVDTNDENEALGTGDVIAPNLILTRSSYGGLINVGESGEGPWETGEQNYTPHGTLWNWTGWDDLTDLKSRDFRSFQDLVYAWNWYGKQIVGREFIMWDTLNDAYYAIKFTRWTTGNYGYDYPGFAYTRRKIDLEKLSHGLKFEDGTTQTTAYSIKASGTVPQAPYNSAQNEERWINQDDIGKFIYLDDSTTNNVKIPDTSTLQWPIGGTVTIVNRTGGTVYLYKDNDDEDGTIYGAGTVDSGTSWQIPDTGGGNIAVIMKIKQGMDGYFNDYILSGAGIVLN